MPIPQENKLSHMDISVKQLTEKHQLNPDNNGVKEIDRAIFYNETNNSYGICSLLRINSTYDRDVYKLTLSGAEPCYIADNSELLLENGTYASIMNGKLKPAAKLYIEENENPKITSIISIDKIAYALLSDIRTSRGNYVLSNGVVIKAD